MMGTKPLSELVFHKYDKDKTGFITVAEFGHLCYELGHYLSEEEVQIAFSDIDKDSAGTIGYPEFATWWKTANRFQKYELSDAEMQELHKCSVYFKYFDKDRTGSITAAEFGDLHADLTKNRYTTKSLEESLKELDQSGDGSVSFNEYVHWLVRIGSLKLAV
eukprot:TRINITY_DN1116_c0_g1_i2.p1 TRINITY_DN1116_c0_g1~~TRINITY_DN1116_c0_g1_i2.p1  ORF type:complete len:162 (-),score=32.87 TRINITY_DN1116_c0_g1_i2:107-592(-)